MLCDIDVVGSIVSREIHTLDPRHQLCWSLIFAPEERDLRVLCLSQGIPTSGN